MKLSRVRTSSEEPRFADAMAAIGILRYMRVNGDVRCALYFMSGRSESLPDRPLLWFSC